MMPEQNEDPAESFSVEALDEWLVGRVADENDIVIDEMQEEFAQLLEEKEDDSFLGSKEYNQNKEYLRTSIAQVKAPGSKLALVGDGAKQKITDGIRTCWYGGHRDAEGRPHGEGMLRYENKEIFTGKFEHGVLTRQGVFKDEHCLNTEGRWEDGLMTGEMRVDTVVGGWIEGYWKWGVPHGFQREFGANDFNGRRTLKFAGRFYRGVRRGFCWQGCLGGGFLCGRVDEKGEFSGDNIAFIYSDFRTCVRGSFDNGRLVNGQMCELQSFTFEFGIAVPAFSPPTSNEVYSFEYASLKSIGRHPLLRDPWEDCNVHVKPSLLPQGGEGLFAKRDFLPKEMLCFFNGNRIRTSTYASTQLDHSDYRIRLNADIDLDIPDDCLKLEQYCATLGHKANHSNTPNAIWALVEHPRFGLIRGLCSQVALKKGDEIMINYQINLADAPEWFQKVWLQHQRQHKKMSDDSIRRVLARYEENTGKSVNLNLDDDEFVVPEPKGACNLDHLEEEEEDDVEGSENEPKDLDRMKRLLNIREMQFQSDTMDAGARIQEID